MELSRRVGAALGVLTVLSMLSPFIMLPFVLLDLPRLYPFAAVLVLTLGLTLFYAYFVIRAGRETLVGQVRWPWILLVFFGGSVGQLVFWYLNIWQDKGRDAGAMHA